MANDIVPMPEMFEACYQVLTRELTPIHYANLTKLALESLGLTERDVHWQRQIEDVREKMLLAGYRESFYIGHPYCLGGLRWWFKADQLRLFHPTQGIIIPGSASCGAEGAFEALMRDPYLKIKTLAPRYRIAKARASGLVLEKHVAGWFKSNWPGFYLPPDNESKWDQVCSHDFKLCVDGYTFEIDVTGPRQNGTFGNPGNGKSRVNFHLACEIIGQDVLWKSVVAGSKYANIIDPDSDGVYPEKMIVWLNCKRDGVNYEAIKESLSQKGSPSQFAEAA